LHADLYVFLATRSLLGCAVLEAFSVGQPAMISSISDMVEPGYAPVPKSARKRTQYGGPLGLNEELRDAIATYLRTSRRRPLQSGAVMIVRKSQQALRFSRAFSSTLNSSVASKNLDIGYSTCLACELSGEPRPGDREGMDVAAGIKCGARPGCLCCALPPNFRLDLRIEVRLRADFGTGA